MKKIHTNISQSSLTDKTKYRDRIDLLHRRASLLTGKDRLLMIMYLERGNSYRQMARLAGVAETSIARRIQKITERLIDGEYITCLRNRDKFTRTEMAVAKDCFLLRLPQRKIAAKRNYSIYRVRKILKRIRELVQTIRHQSEQI